MVMTSSLRKASVKAKSARDVVKRHEAAAREASLPEQGHSCSVQERLKTGKALRLHCPRHAHAGWIAHTDRVDPVDILIATSEGRVEKLKPIRYGRMMSSPFAFYRGAAAIMASDLSHTPTTGVHLQICGDCHLVNFGGFATPERQLVFDINDFDETTVGPWEWDVKRLVTSFVVAGRSNGFSDDNAREAAWCAAAAYRDAMIGYGKMPVLDAWYDHIDLQGLIDGLVDPAMRKFLTSKVRKATKASAHTKEFTKLAVAQGLPPRIRDQPPLIYHDKSSDAALSRKDIDQAFKKYRQSLPAKYRIVLDRFKEADLAVKVVGVGSVGTYCGIMLMVSGAGDPLFLQFKEAQSSVIEPFIGASTYRHHGHRVVAGQWIMQSASDIFLGWMSGERRDYYVRQLRDAKISPEIGIMKPLNLRNYGRLCGHALARAHARSGDAVMLGSYLGKGDAFPDALTEFSVDYANQNERDHQALVEAVRSGRVVAQSLS